MGRAFGFNTKKAINLNLYLDELYVLDWIIYYYSSKKLIFSTEKPDFFLLVHKRIQKDCSVLRYKSIRQIATILKRLCGEAPESVKGVEYPLVSFLSTERGFRNVYYKLNIPVIKELMEKEIVPMREVKHDVEYKLSDEFVNYYNQIKNIYDFRHNINLPSKILLNAQNHIFHILNKTFISTLKWNNVWLQKQDLSMLDNPSFDLILDAIKEYKKATSEGGWLSKNPKKISLDRFFYNPDTEKSFFIIMLQTKRKVPLIGEELEYFNKVVTKFCANYNFPPKDISWGMFSIYEYWYKYFDKLVDYQGKNKVEKWYSVFGHSPKFGILISLYTEFLKNKNFSISDIGRKTKLWYKFCRYIYLQYGKLKLEFNTNFYKKLELSIDFSEKDDYISD